MFTKTRNTIAFIGRDVAKYFTVLLFIGIAYFLVETSFAFILQYFLVSLGIMEVKSLSFQLPLLTGPWVLICLIGLGAVRSLCYYLKVYFSNVTQQYFIESQRNRIFRKVMRNNELDLSLSEVLATFSDVVTQSGQLIFYLSNLMVTALATLLLFLYGFYLVPYEMLAAAIALVTLVLPLRFMNASIHNFGRAILNEWSQTNSSLVTGIRNKFYLRICGAIDSQVKQGCESLVKYRDHYINFSKSLSLLTALPVFIGVVVVAMVTFVSLNYIKTPGPLLLTFFYIFIRMSQMASESISAVSQLRLNSQYLNRLKDLDALLSKSNNLTENVKTESLVKDLLTITTSDLGFTYDGSNYLFRGISLNLKIGDVLVIKGESGKGKSTLLSLLLGLKTPSVGTVQFNQSFCGVHPDSIAYVGPEPFLCPATIRENLVFANNRSLDDTPLWSALRAVDLEGVINKLPLKLDQRFSEDVPMSTGEKQRLAAARAILRDPKLFVLDEATANLDHETEKVLIREFAKRFANSITIIVTHKNTFDDYATQKLDLNSL